MMVSWNRPFWNYHRLVFLLAALILPFLFQNNLYRLFFFNTIIIFAILALGLQLVLGFGGILHLGYAGFFGLGAYTSAILTVRFGWPFIPAFVASIAVAIIGGAIMCPIIRLRDVYFALASFVFGLILELVFNQWSAVTNGPIGFRGIPPASLFGFAFVQPMHYYFLLVAILLGYYFAFFRLLNSPFGTALQAMREHETACQISGVNTSMLKIKLILIGCGVAGAAGSLLAHMNGFISPPSFGWIQTVMILMIIVVGGTRSLAGAILGAIVIRYLIEQTSILGTYSNIIFGIILLLFIAFLPEGFAGLFRWLTGDVQWLRWARLRRAELD